MSVRAKTGIRASSAAAALCMLAGAACADWVSPPWLPTPGGITSNASQPGVRGIRIIDGIPYIVGDFTHAGGVEVNGITAWNGTDWLAFGPTPTTPGVSKAVGAGIVVAAIEYNGQLVMGGSFIATDDGFTQLSHVAVFDEGTGEWGPLGFGVSVGIGNDGIVNAFTIHDNKLIVAGQFDQVERLGPFPQTGYSNIAAWDGSSWSNLGGGLTDTGFLNAVYDVEVYNGELYAVGAFTNAGATTLNNIAKWNGSAWVDVGGGLTGGYGYGQDLEVYNGELYVAGSFTDAGGVATSAIAKWNGSAWSGLEGGVAGSPLSGFLGPLVNSITTFDGKLVATGEFDTAGTTAVQSIASWDGTTWANNIFTSGLSGGFLGGSLVKGNGDTLYVAGDFESAGGVSNSVLLTYVAAPSCPADFNGDNTRDVADLFAYINAWLAKTTNADFNGDTAVDVADLFAYINAWLAGC